MRDFCYRYRCQLRSCRSRKLFTAIADFTLNKLNAGLPGKCQRHLHTRTLLWVRRRIDFVAIKYQPPVPGQLL